MDLRGRQAGDETTTTTTGWYSAGGGGASTSSSSNSNAPPNGPTGGGGQQQHVHVISSQNTTTIFDVQRCVRDAQAAYEGRIGHKTADTVFQNVMTPNTTTATTTAFTSTNSGPKKAQVQARLWLTSLSEKLVHYGNIFDVMAQHHPEYVSLAWGTFKLTFIAITNHAETISKLGKSMCLIADLLPQHSLHLILYPTPQMQTSVARLYAHILNFLLSSLKWYNDSRTVHAFKSIFQPWDLKFKQDYEAIAAEAQQVGRLADVALKAEVRDTRLEVVQGTRHWELVRQEINQLKVENERLASLLQAKFGIMEDSIHLMYKEIRLDFTSQRATLSRIHLNQMLSLPLWNSLPTSGESLQFCQSMRNRRRERKKLPLLDVKKLQTWSSLRNNAVLLIDTHVPIVAKTFMVDLINLILDNRFPIIWALRYADYQDRRTRATDIIRMLVLQAMQIGADCLLDTLFPVTVEQLREAGSLDEWVQILNHLLTNRDHTFIALDADLLAHATAYERSEALEMLEMLRSKLSGDVKIITATSSVSQSYAEELEHLNACVKIQTGNAGDWRRPRRPQRPMVRFRK